MSRWVNAANEAAAATADQVPITFCFLNLDSGVVRAHDQGGSIAWGGNNWLGTGKFGHFDPIEESLESPLTEVLVKLSGVDATYITQFAAENHLGRAFELYRGRLDALTYQLAADPELRWKGVIGGTEWNDGEEGCSISVRGIPEWAYGAPIAKYTSEAHRKRFSGETYFDLLSSIEGFVAQIGSMAITYANPGGGPRQPGAGSPGSVQP